jgi:hypothetical protein
VFKESEPDYENMSMNSLDSIGDKVYKNAKEDIIKEHQLNKLNKGPIGMHLRKSNKPRQLSSIFMV